MIPSSKLLLHDCRTLADIVGKQVTMSRRGPGRARSLALAACILVAVSCADVGGRTSSSSSVDGAADRVAGVAADSSPRAAAPDPDSPPRFSRKRAMRHVRNLSVRIGPRVRATRGERRATRYIARRMERLGYRVRVGSFPVDGGTSHNVVAWWPGAERYPVIVGAHMDTVAGSPGANDNASGVALMLEAARIVAAREPARFVRFVAFGSEELGRDGTHHVGSAGFVQGLGKKGRNRLAGMVSVDMVADGRPLLVTTLGIGPEILADIAARRIRRAGVATERRTTCDCSDNGPFERAGIPAAALWSGFEPDHHEPTDTIPNMSHRDLGRSGRAVRALLLSFDEALLERLRPA